MGKRHDSANIDRIKDAIKVSSSIRQVLLKLGYSPQGGGSYRLIQRWIKEFNIDTSHFTGKGWRKNNFAPVKRIEDYLTNKVPITSHRLKQRLLKDGLKQHKCEICGLSDWLDRSLPLELDHIDGNHFNNELSNLRILCPNCHSQCENHCKGKHKANNL